MKLTRSNSNELNRLPNATEIADHLGVDHDVVVDAMVPVGNLSTLTTDAPVGHGNDRQLTFGDTVGEVDPGMDKVLDVETARPLIEALLIRQQTVLMLRFFEDGKARRTRPFGLARFYRWSCRESNPAQKWH